MTTTGTTIPWTRLKGTEIYREAMAAQSGSRSRHYHNADHVAALYRHAENTLSLPYDRALDLAILTHDVVFDQMNDRELRSIEWLRLHLDDEEDDPDFEAAADHIARTIDHHIDADPRMVLLDLADFADPEVSSCNTDLLRMEAAAIHGLDAAVFATGCGTFLQKLHERIRDADTSGMTALQKDLHADICAGIVRARNGLYREERDLRLELEYV